jgi:hypothetical protein
VQLKLQIQMMMRKSRPSPHPSDEQDGPKMLQPGLLKRQLPSVLEDSFNPAITSVCSLAAVLIGMF